MVFSHPRLLLEWSWSLDNVFFLLLRKLVPNPVLSCNCNFNFVVPTKSVRTIHHKENIAESLTRSFPALCRLRSCLEQLVNLSAISQSPRCTSVKHNIDVVKLRSIHTHKMRHRFHLKDQVTSPTLRIFRVCTLTEKSFGSEKLSKKRVLIQLGSVPIFLGRHFLGRTSWSVCTHGYDKKVLLRDRKRRNYYRPCLQGLPPQSQNFFPRHQTMPPPPTSDLITSGGKIWNYMDRHPPPPFNRQIENITFPHTMFAGGNCHTGFHLQESKSVWKIIVVAKILSIRLIAVSGFDQE